MDATKVNMKLAKEQYGDRPLVMYCDICQDTFSASPGDYLGASDDHIFKCCGQPMQIGYMYEAFQPISLDTME